MNLLQSLIPTANRTSTISHGQQNQDLGSTLEPRYEINEQEDAFGVSVFLPGVAKSGLEITSDAETLRIVGRRNWRRPEDWTVTYRETEDASYVLELEHDSGIDVEKIHAELKDGVLRLSLPKTVEVKPRKITVS